MKAPAALLGVVILVLTIWWFGLRADPTIEPAPSAPPAAAALQEVGTPSVPAEEPLVRASLAVQEPGHLPTGQAMPSPDAIHGRVVNEIGVPQAGVAVRLWRLGGEPRSRGWFVPPEQVVLDRVLTDAEGIFRFAAVRSPECGLTAETVGHEELRFPVAPGSWIEIQLGAGNRLVGQVRCDGHESETFAGTARLGTEHGFKQWLEVPIATDGGFTFDSVPPGEYQVVAEIAGHAKGGGTSVLLLAWGETVDVDLTVQPGMVVTGRVVHAQSDEPIADAVVHTIFGNLPESRTDASGAFRMDGIAERFLQNGNLEILADKAGFLTGAAFLTRDAAVLIRLEPYPELPIRVSGAVLDASGQPLAGVQVSTWQSVMLGEDPEQQPLRQTAHTDHAGRFELRWIEDDTPELHLTGVDGEDYVLFLGVLKSDRDLGEVRLPAQRTVSVRCVDEAGNPVAGARISASQSIDHAEESQRVPDYRWGPISLSSVGGVTDVFGRCTLRIAEMEDAWIGVSVGEIGRQWAFPVPAADAGEQTFILEELRRATGRAVFADGSPVRRGLLRLLEASGASSIFDPFGMGESYLLARDGSFLIYGRSAPILTGNLFIHEEDLRGRVPVPELRLDEGPLTIVVPDPQPVAGIVRDAAGAPLADARVLLIWEDDEEALLAHTGADGRFSARVLLTPGLRIVALQGERCSPAQPLTASAPVELVVPAR